ncbi:interferon lambda receptor 1 [Spea bombifrons]|uniref:interferon lambda receptor 1 n=1 Tax=Spea bombifrons TaxID=233779 RepID=UPI002349F73E|nr:interferon lambda receptor 1 [Spea bombifrons]
MSARFTCAFLLCQCFTTRIAFAGSLHSPLNLTTVSRNFSLFLTWLPAPGNPTDVFYHVSYQLVSEKIWKPVKGCKNIIMTECDLTCTLKEYHLNYEVRVRTLFGTSLSPWIKSEKISYMFTIEPDPPTINVTIMNNNIYVKAAAQTPTCLTYVFNLKYDIEIWKSGESTQSIYSNEMVGSILTKEMTGLKGTYCIAARTRYTVDQTKLSKFSSPFCQLINEGENPLWGMIIGIPLSLFLLCCGLFIIYIKHCRTPATKVPNTLVFTQYAPCFQASAFTAISCEEYHKVTSEEKRDKDHEAILSPTPDGVDDYFSPGLGYTERCTLQEESLEHCSTNRDCYIQTPSRSLLTCSNTDQSSSSGLSFGEYEGKSGPTAVLTLDDIKTNDQSVTILKTESTKHGLHVREPTKTTSFTDMLCTLDLNGNKNVPFETLQIAGEISGMENADGISCDQFYSDSEDLELQSMEDLSRITDNVYCKREQNTRCTGYEKKMGYMSRNAEHCFLSS